MPPERRALFRRDAAHAARGRDLMTALWLACCRAQPGRKARAAGLFVAAYVLAILVLTAALAGLAALLDGGAPGRPQPTSWPFATRTPPAR